MADKYIDGGITAVKADADRVHAIESYSTDYSAVVADSFADYAPVITNGDRASGGREASLAAANGLTTSNITTTKEFTHYAVVDSVAQVVIMVAPADGKTYSSGDTMNVDAYPIYQLPYPVSD